MELGILKDKVGVWVEGPSVPYIPAEDLGVVGVSYRRLFGQEKNMFVTIGTGRTVTALSLPRWCSRLGMLLQVPALHQDAQGLPNRKEVRDSVLSDKL